MWCSWFSMRDLGSRGRGFESRHPDKGDFTMKQNVRFFKQGSNWYADIPNHSLEENEMVMGSDIALEFLAKGKSELTATLSDEDEKHSILTMTMSSHDDEGAYYKISGFLYNEFMNNFIDNPDNFINEIWICNVTHDVFGCHPKNIYLLKLE